MLMMRTVRSAALAALSVLLVAWPAQAATTTLAAPPATAKLSLEVRPPQDPVVPGETGILEVKVTNDGPATTTDDTLVVVHSPPPGVVRSADPPVTLTYFGTGSSYRIPAGLAPGASSAERLSLFVAPITDPFVTISGDVQVFYPGDPDQSGRTTPYSFTTADTAAHFVVGASSAWENGHPVPQPGDLTGKPGATVNLPLWVYNAGPSYSRHPIDVSITVPAQTTPTGTTPYGCTVASPRTLTCHYESGPRFHDAIFIDPAVVIDSSTVAGQVLPGGTLDVVAAQGDCPSPDWHTDFVVTVDGPAREQGNARPGA
ncbi:COG1361 family protein [Kitasatospora cathayae]|uniref:DUF11 domain-containing protein n=1 Tax=Kitasatospora cathayae TaxID=3004092 RepID=A0ABY7Q2I9_9ACTN|nr:hypothetical protein [Kitasatospora sp. HUAS 3-15]WBP86920.1 hypothetical protein O1G21_14470 [Kitasatospora sp. HUAS 3-15]